MFFIRGFIAFIRCSKASTLYLMWLKPLVYNIHDKNLFAYCFEGDGLELKKKKEKGKKREKKVYFRKLA